MLEKIKEITRAWVIAHDPTEEQQERANRRLEVCIPCSKREFYPTLNINICMGCGCPIAKKAYSEKPNACPLKKWDWEEKIKS